MLLVCLIALVAVAVSAPTEPHGYLCCMPKQFEANIFEMGSIHAPKYKSEFVLMGKLSYDQVGDAVAFGMDYFAYPHTNVKSKVIINYKLKTMYKIYKEKCVVTSFPAAFQPACIPDGAKKVAHFFIGMNKDSLNADAYMIHTGGLTTTVSITKECVIVGEMIHGQYGGVSAFANVGYSNVTEGIQDPHVFIPPESCKHSSKTLTYFPHHVQQLWDYVADKYSRNS